MKTLVKSILIFLILTSCEGINNAPVDNLSFKAISNKELTFYFGRAAKGDEEAWNTSVSPKSAEFFELRNNYDEDSVYLIYKSIKDFEGEDYIELEQTEYMYSRIWSRTEVDRIVKIRITVNKDTLNL